MKRVNSYIRAIFTFLFCVLLVVPSTLTAQTMPTCAFCANPLNCCNRRINVCQECMIDAILVHDFSLLAGLYSCIDNATSAEYEKTALKYAKRLDKRKKQPHDKFIYNTYLSTYSCDIDAPCTCMEKFFGSGQKTPKDEDVIKSRFLRSRCWHCKGLIFLAALLDEKILDNAIYCTTCWALKMRSDSAEKLLLYLRGCQDIDLKERGIDLTKAEMNAWLARNAFKRQKDLYLNKKQQKPLPLSFNSLLHQ